MRIQKQPPEVSKQAYKAIKAMDKHIKSRIKKGIEGIPEGDIVPLEGTKDSYRLRVGNYRIIFNWITDEQILISKISPRGDVYKGA